MPTLLIRSEAAITSTTTYRAAFDGTDATGATPGQAMDALMAKVGPVTFARLTVVIEPVDGPSLSAEQRSRLDDLTRLYKPANAGHGIISSAERDEMERLFDAEFAASEQRALALAGRPGA